MYEQLYRYFILHRELIIPGIGTLLLHEKSSSLDVSARSINPPSFHISLEPGNGTPSKKFFAWISDTFQISERDAVIRFNDFVFDLKKEIQSGSEILWHGVGSIRKEENDKIIFVPVSEEIVFEEPVSAEKIIREDAVHAIRVGEQEKTSVEMKEMLTYHEPKASLWWAYALILGLLSIVFIGWYFSTHGINISSSSNQSKISPSDMPLMHQTIQ